MLGSYTMAESMAELLSNGFISLPEVAHWTTIAGIGLACATIIVQMQMAKRYPTNPKVFAKVGRQLMCVFGVFVILAGWFGVMAKLLSWFSTGMLVSCAMILSGVGAIAAFIALQIDDVGLGAYLPADLQKKIMRSSPIAVLLDRTMSNRVKKLWRHYGPKLRQIARAVSSRDNPEKFELALEEMDPELRRAMQCPGTVYLFPSWMQRILLPSSIRRSPEYAERQRLSIQQAQLPTPPVSESSADSIPSALSLIPIGSLDTSSVVGFFRTFLARRLHQTLAKIQPRVAMIGALTGTAAIMQISISKRTRKWLVAAAATILFLSCATISGGAGVLLLLQRRFRDISSDWQARQAQRRRRIRRTNSVPEIVNLGMGSVFNDLLHTRPRDVTIGFFCLSIVIFLIRRRARM